MFKIKRPCTKLAQLVFIALLTGACSGKKSQQEQYEDATSGVRFNTYKKTSGAALGPAVQLYNSQRADSLPPIDPAYAHLLLGYGWTVSGKPTLAFAEADLASETGDSTAQYLATSLRAIGMYEQGWDTLARQESQRQRLMRKPVGEAAYQASVFYMLMGLMKAYERDFAQSKFFWAGFGNETQIHWPYKLTDAIDDLQQNRLQTALVKLKALSQDPDVPPVLQQTLAEQIALVETQAGDVNSRLFWPRLISTLVLDQLKKSSHAQLGPVVKMVEELRERFD